MGLALQNRSFPKPVSLFCLVAVVVRKTSETRFSVLSNGSCFTASSRSPFLFSFITASQSPFLCSLDDPCPMKALSSQLLCYCKSFLLSVI